MYRKTPYIRPWVYTVQRAIWWAYMRGASTPGNNKIFSFSCNMKLLQIIITAQQLMVSPDQSKVKFIVFIVFTCIFIFIIIVVQQLKFFLYISLRDFIAYNIRFFSLKPLHCKGIFLSGNFLLKMASVKLGTVTLSIKYFHVHRRSPDIGEKLKCV